MKAFRVKILMLSLLASFLLTSCSKDNSWFVPVNEKIIGTWTFEKAKFNKRFSFKSYDSLENFKNIVIEFNSDYTVTQSDTFGKLIRCGIWEIETISQTNGDGSTSNENILIISLLDPKSLDMELWNWEDFSVNGTRISCRESCEGGSFSYKLVRR